MKKIEQSPPQVLLAAGCGLWYDISKDTGNDIKFEVEGGGLYGDTYWFSTFEGFSNWSGGKNGALYTHSRIK